MKLILTALVICVSAIAVHYNNDVTQTDVEFENPETRFAKIKNNSTADEAKRSGNKKLQFTAATLKEYANRHNYNDSIFFIADMSQASGRKRFYVYNANADSVLAGGLVAHGQGNMIGSTVQYSNTPGSYCTSEGIYKIGKSYMGTFGLAYKLYGLQASNSNAFRRFVVLHAHSCVPDEEVYPQRICLSLGCPTVSPAFLDVLDGYLKKSEKEILLEIIK